MNVESTFHHFLRGMSQDHLKILTDASMYAQFEPGEIIFREGEPANRFYLLHTGQVELETTIEENGLVSIQKIGAGEVLGWSWLFPPYYWHFNARATQRTTATFYYGTRLRETCEHDHNFGFEMMKRISQVLLQRLQSTRRNCSRV